MFIVVIHGGFHTRLPGVCSGGRFESPPESLYGSDARPTQSRCQDLNPGPLARKARVLTTEL